MLNTPTLNRLNSWYSRIKYGMNAFRFTEEEYKDDLEYEKIFPGKRENVFDQIREYEFIVGYGFGGWFRDISGLDEHLEESDFTDIQKARIKEGLNGERCRPFDVEMEFWSLCKTPADIQGLVRIFKVKLKEFLEIPNYIDLEFPSDIFDMESEYRKNIDNLFEHEYIDDRERYYALSRLGGIWSGLKGCSEKISDFLEECMSMTEGYQEVEKMGKPTHDKTIKYNPSDVLENYQFWNDQPNRQGRRNIFDGVSEAEFLRMIDQADFSPILKKGLKGRVKFNIYALSKIMGDKWGESSAKSIKSTLRECSGNTNFEEYEELKSLFNK